MQVEGVCLSQFHEKAGFQLVVNVPENSPLTSKQFELYSELMLPKEQLCGRLLAVQYLEEYFLVGLPCLSRNKGDRQIYGRKLYIYCLTIIVRKEAYLAAQGRYNRLAREAGLFFKHIEQTSQVIYRHVESLEYLQSVVTAIFREVNTKSACNLNYFCQHFAFIDLRSPPNPPFFGSFLSSSVLYCPLTPNQLTEISSGFGRDLLAIACEGVSTLHKICLLHKEKSEAEVRKFFQVAQKKGLVYELGMFSLSNVFILTKSILEFLPSQPRFGQICKIARAVSGGMVGGQEVLSIFFQFTRMSTLKKVIEKNIPLLRNISFFRLLSLGAAKGLIRKVEEKVCYGKMPQDFLVIEQLKKITQQKGEEYTSYKSRLVKTLAQHIERQDSLQEMAVSVNIESNRLLRLLSAECRYVLKTNPEKGGVEMKKSEGA